jgi:hypothetical protein
MGVHGLPEVLAADAAAPRVLCRERLATTMLLADFTLTERYAQHKKSLNRAEASVKGAELGCQHGHLFSARSGGPI